jgi:hypothetical protein
MRYACLLAAMALLPLWGQVKPTPGALAPIAAAPATPPAAVPTARPAAKTGNTREIFKKLESDFDYELKVADPKNPMDVLGMTRGLYVPGFGVVFTTEVDLARSDIMPMFTKITAEEKSATRDRKLKHVDLLRRQMREMMATAARDLDFLGPNDQVVVAVRLLYQGWEDRTGLPEQIVMKADRRGVASGDIKVDVQ